MQLEFFIPHVSLSKWYYHCRFDGVCKSFSAIYEAHTCSL